MRAITFVTTLLLVANPLPALSLRRTAASVMSSFQANTAFSLRGSQASAPWSRRRISPIHLIVSAGAAATGTHYAGQTKGTKFSESLRVGLTAVFCSTGAATLCSVADTLENMPNPNSLTTNSLRGTAALLYVCGQLGWNPLAAARRTWKAGIKKTFLELKKTLTKAALARGAVKIAAPLVIAYTYVRPSNPSRQAGATAVAAHNPRSTARPANSSAQGGMRPQPATPASRVAMPSTVAGGNPFGARSNATATAAAQGSTRGQAATSDGFEADWVSEHGDEQDQEEFDPDEEYDDGEDFGQLTAVPLQPQPTALSQPAPNQEPTRSPLEIARMVLGQLKARIKNPQPGPPPEGLTMQALAKKLVHLPQDEWEVFKAEIAGTPYTIDLLQNALTAEQERLTAELRERQTRKLADEQQRREKAKQQRCKFPGCTSFSIDTPGLFLCAAHQNRCALGNACNQDNRFHASGGTDVLRFCTTHQDHHSF